MTGLIGRLTGIAFLLVLAGAAAQTQTGPDPSMQLILLGTAGGPGGKTTRAGIASLVSIGDEHYLVDAGEGVSRQLAHAGLKESQIGTVLLTHLHDDHTAGLPGLVTFAHTLRSGGMSIIGPPGTERLVDGLLAYIGVNAEIRMAEQRSLEAPGTRFIGHEVPTGEVISEAGLRVTAIENTHFRIPGETTASRNKSYSYRFDTPGRSIVFTGDTGPSEAVEKLAMGADVLVSEMASAADIASVPPFVREHMVKEHLTATEVGKLAARAEVGKLILSHIGTVTDEDVARIRAHFSGPVVVGKDLDRF